MKKIPYLTTVGSIMYAATTTHLGVAHAVQHLNQFNNNQGNAHCMASQCIIRYLYYTRTRSLVLSGPEIKLTGWWTWKGTNAQTHVTQLLGTLSQLGLVSWSSKKQPTVAMSTTEAQYIASCHGM